MRQGLLPHEIERLEKAGFDAEARDRIARTAASMPLIPLHRRFGRPVVYFLLLALSYVAAMLVLSLLPEPLLFVLVLAAAAGGAVLGAWLRWWLAGPASAERMAARRLARLAVTSRSPLINGLADPLAEDAERVRRAHLSGEGGEGLSGLAAIRRREAGKHLAAGLAVAGVLSIPVAAVTLFVFGDGAGR